MIPFRRPLLALLLASLMLAGCARAPALSVPVDDSAEIAARLEADITALADDAMAGRKPGTAGARATYAYIERRMGEVGLVSGTNDPGSYWRLPVDLLETEPQSAQLVLGQGRRRVVVPASDAAVYTPRRRALAIGGPGTGVPVVFVGYGDGSVLGDALAGAVAVMLADPGRDGARRDALFRQRATAVLTVLPDAEELERVRRQEERPRLQLASDEKDHLAAYITDKAFADLVGARRWKALRTEAEDGAFAPLELNLSVSLEATSDRREFPSQNILGMIPGSVPGSGAVLLLAHWDHLGECGAPTAADRICNGAADNASGVAMLLELARRLKAGPPMERDIYFLATTAEEPGLLGALSFLRNPPMPLGSIVAAFNLDMMAVAPAGSPVGFIGRGQSPALDAAILEAVAASGRRIGDQALADSFLQRQDGWALVQAGVPTVLLSGTYGSRAVLDPFLVARYHKPGDEADAIELGGAIEDLLLHEALVRRIADPARYPAPAPARP
jgi:outer membrane murein-binding lipoprotein Lpp